MSIGFRHLVVLASVCYMFFHVLNGIEKVMRKDIGIVFTSELINDHAVYQPSFTLCPNFESARFSYSKFSGWRNLTVANAMENGPDISDFINTPHPDLWRKIYKVSKNLDRDNRILLTPCYTYNHTKPFLLGAQKSIALLDVKMTDVNRLTLFVHENPGYAYMFLNYHGSAYINIGSLEEHTDPDRPIQTQEIHFFLTSEISQKLDEQENCAGSKFELDLTCVERFIENKIGCKIPWAYPETGNNHLAPCSSAQDLRNIINSYPDESIMSPTDIKMFMKQAGCSVMCKNKRFVLSKKKDEIFVDNSRIHPQVLIAVETLNQDIQVQKEILLFDFWSLFSSIGGFAGLLLGYSILSFVEILTNQLDKIIEAVNIRRKKKKARSKREKERLKRFERQ